MFGPIFGTRLLRGLHAQVILAVVMAVVSVGMSQPSSAAATEQGTITSTNLLTNGGFESGPSIPPAPFNTYYAGSNDITGWTVTQGSVDHKDDEYWEAAEGTSSVDLNGNESGGIAQSFATVAGASYLLSLDMAGNPDGNPPLKTMTVKASGQSTTFSFDTSGTSRGNMGWANRTWVFTADSTSTTLEFQSDTLGSPYGPSLDNVSVVMGGSVASTVTSDSYTMLKYVPTFSTAECITNLKQNRIRAATLVCGALRASANSTPPTSFDRATLASFIASKEYRAYTHIPAYSVTCVSGTVQSIAPAGSDYNFEDTFSWSLGYTKVVDRNTKTGLPEYDYYIGDRYLGDSSIGGPAVDITYAPNRSFVDVSFASASRLSNVERKANYYLTGYDAPFIWTKFRERISCDGSRAASVAYNNFPTTNTYVNGQQVSSDPISDIAKFLKQGGKVLNPVGYGPLAGPCHTEVFASGTALPWNPTDLCLIPDYI